jgi:predicted nucleic acid-binding protein
MSERITVAAQKAHTCAIGSGAIPALAATEHVSEANLVLPDLADASLVLLAEKLGHGRILSTDLRDFGAYRWKNREPFQNLLFPDT